eukprot:9476328-Pyramimonas_sp.AAC.2
MVVLCEYRMRIASGKGDEGTLRALKCYRSGPSRSSLCFPTRAAGHRVSRSSRPKPFQMTRSGPDGPSSQP